MNFKSSFSHSEIIPLLTYFYYFHIITNLILIALGRKVQFFFHFKIEKFIIKFYAIQISFDD